MNLTEYCWTTAEYMTKKKPDQLEILLDNDNNYSRLQTNASGYVIRLSMPRRISDDLLVLHGMPFDNDVKGRASLWRMFRASLYHLCLHTVVSEYNIYSKEFSSRGDRKLQANSIFAMSVVEDYDVRAYARAAWPGLLYDLAYANYIGASRFRDFDGTRDDREYSITKGLGKTAEVTLADRIAANILSYSSIKDMQVVKIDSEIDSKIKKTISNLERFESFAMDVYAKTQFQSDQQAVTSSFRSKIHEQKLDLFKQILDLFEKNFAYLSTAHTFPHTESHVTQQRDALLFESGPTKFKPKEIAKVFSEAMKSFGVQVQSQASMDDDATYLESESVLGSWEYSFESQNSLADLYKRYDPDSHFESVSFPSGNYAEFVRTRRKLAGPISALLDELRVVNFSLEESHSKDVGEIDLENAIQSVLTGRALTDIYKREELLGRDEAWSILIDSSKSLEVKKQQVRDIAVCLSEIANDLIQNSYSWACYSFNENFHIVKDFIEPYDRVVKGRIGGLPNGIQTLLPDAMRLAANRLLEEAAEVKVMLVISDGFPLGYQGIDKELIKEVERIANSGILLVGLGIGSSAIKKYFRSNLVVEGTFDLMQQFVNTYVQLPYLIL